MVQVRAGLSEAGYLCWTQPPANALEQRYLGERRRSQRMEDIAPRTLASAHDSAHDGNINARPYCATDWAQLRQHGHLTV